MTDQSTPGNKPTFQLASSLLPFVLPLSKFAALPSNIGRKLYVGVVIVRALPDYEGEGGDGDGESSPSSSPSSFTSPLDNKESLESKPKAKSKPKETPGAVLVRPIPTPRPTSSPSTESQAKDKDQRPGKERCPRPPHDEGWDILTAACEFGTDQTLLETVARCVRETIGGEVKEMARLLGTALIDLNTGEAVKQDLKIPSVERTLDYANPAGIDAAAEKEQSNIGRRFDIIVRLHKEPEIKPVEGWEMKWVDTAEVWRVMKRLPPGIDLQRRDGGRDQAGAQAVNGGEQEGAKEGP